MITYVLLHLRSRYFKNWRGQVSRPCVRISDFMPKPNGVLKFKITIITADTVKHDSWGTKQHYRSNLLYTAFTNRVQSTFLEIPFAVRQERFTGLLMIRSCTREEYARKHTNGKFFVSLKFAVTDKSVETYYASQKIALIRESVDSLCRDATDTHIV